MKDRLKKAAATLATTAVIVGGIVLGTAGVASAWSNAVGAHAVASTQCGVYSATLTITGTGADGNHTATATYSSVPVASSISPSSTGTVSSASGVSEVTTFTFPASDAGAGVTLTATVSNWPTDSSTYHYSAGSTLAAACPVTTTTTLPPTTTTTAPPVTTTTLPPTTTTTVPTTVPPAPVKPIVTLDATASTSCGDYTVPLVLTAGAGANLPNGTVGYATFGSGYVPTFGLLHPSSTLDASVTFPAADAGNTESVGAVVQWTGFTVAVPVSVDVTLPGACPVGTTTTVGISVPGGGTPPPGGPPTAPVVTIPPGFLQQQGPGNAALVAPAAPSPLAFTGADIGAEAAIGAGLLGLGALLVFAARRRRQAS